LFPFRCRMAALIGLQYRIVAIFIFLFVSARNLFA